MFSISAFAAQGSGLGGFKVLFTRFGFSVGRFGYR